MTPPPRQTSPWYSTADWPGVTAHWASANDSSATLGGLVVTHLGFGWLGLTALSHTIALRPRAAHRRHEGGDDDEND